jgi:nucleoside-diphosphate-sugar epimerase
MRFDLVLNNLSGLAWTTREIRMTSDGTPWRPLIHVADVCKAFRCAIEAPRQTVHNQVLNVGDSKANYRVREVAEIVAEVFPGCVTSFGTGDKDNRSYRVDFGRIRAVLPAFSCDHDARSGARELRERFAAIGMTREIFEHRAFTRLKQLRYLLDTKQINADLYWRDAGGETPTG